MPLILKKIKQVHFLKTGLEICFYFLTFGFKVPDAKKIKVVEDDTKVVPTPETKANRERSTKRRKKGKAPGNAIAPAPKQQLRPKRLTLLQKVSCIANRLNVFKPFYNTFLSTAFARRDFT